jgi:hypothetical protein
LRIVFGDSSSIRYPQGGGLWSWILQYPLALKALGHDLFWLELFTSTGSRGNDVRMVREFFSRLREYDLDGNCAVILLPGNLDRQDLGEGEIFGKSRESVREIIRDSDVLLNFCCFIRQPLLSMFRRRALLDFDPGHLQVSALSWDLNIADHDVWLTIGTRINAPDSRIPKLGVRWKTFDGFVYTPMWRAAPDPGAAAPFTSITQWTWETLPLGDRSVSVSKRQAYLNYAELPRLARRPIELAANIGEADPGGDRDFLRERGWRLADPHQVAYSPRAYQEYIRASRGEFMCPKPIHIDLKTGWFSDRSLSYLASGRPVVAEDSGFTERLPGGTGLIAFRDVREAADAIARIDGDYERHRRAAREIAEDHFNWRKCADAMLAAACET